MSAIQQCYSCTILNRDPRPRQKRDTLSKLGIPGNHIDGNIVSDRKRKRSGVNLKPEKRQLQAVDCAATLYINLQTVRRGEIRFGERSAVHAEHPALTNELDFRTDQKSLLLCVKRSHHKFLRARVQRHGRFHVLNVVLREREHAGLIRPQRSAAAAKIRNLHQLIDFRAAVNRHSACAGHKAIGVKTAVDHNLAAGLELHKTAGARRAAYRRRVGGRGMLCADTQSAIDRNRHAVSDRQLFIDRRRSIILIDARINRLQIRYYLVLKAGVLVVVRDQKGDAGRDLNALGQRIVLQKNDGIFA